MKPVGKIDRIIVTSGQSLESLCSGIPLSTPLTAVGARTAERARMMGFTTVDHASGTAHSLLDHLGHTEKPHRLLLATGRNLGNELANRLRGMGWQVTRRVVYRSQPVGPLDSSSRSLIEKGHVAAILFYSAATARAFLDAFGPERSLLESVRALALSPHIGETLRTAPFRKIDIASTPEQQALLALLGPLPGTDHTEA